MKLFSFFLSFFLSLFLFANLFVNLFVCLFVYLFIFLIFLFFLGFSIICLEIESFPPPPVADIANVSWAFRCPHILLLLPPPTPLYLTFFSNWNWLIFVCLFIHIYKYIFVCVCVCVCVSFRTVFYCQYYYFRFDWLMIFFCLNLTGCWTCHFAGARKKASKSEIKRRMIIIMIMITKNEECLGIIWRIFLRLLFYSLTLKSECVVYVLHLTTSYILVPLPPLPPPLLFCCVFFPPAPSHPVYLLCM